MAVSFVNAGAMAEKATGTGTISPAYPAGLAANDLLLLFVGNNNATHTTLPAGWTSIRNVASTTDTVVPSILVARIFATGSESGTLAVTTPTSAANAQILAFRGVDLTTPEDFSNILLDKTATTGTAFTFSAATTTVPGTALIYAIIQNAGFGAWTPPANIGSDAWVEDGQGAAQRSATTGHLLWSGSGSTGTITVTSASGQRGVGVLVGLRPAAAVATPIRRAGKRRF